MAGKILIVAKTITETAEKITLNANNGDIVFNAAKSVKYSAKKDIIYDSYVAPEAEQTEELLVTKVTCDVKEVEIGGKYTFKAVQFSRKPEKDKDELKNVKWAYKIDDGEIQDFPSGSTEHSYNTAIKEIEIDESLWDNKKLTVYAYMQNPTDDVSVECKIQLVKKVYLTFDDGIQPGTEEVLKVLEETGVKATFFLTGINIVNYGVYYGEEKKNSILEKIISNHEIANHSYSHANDFYKHFYSDGLKIGKNTDGTFKRRSVLEDFERTNKLLGNNQIKLARFPGRNTWRYPKIKITDSDNDNDNDTLDEADLLHQKGYVIYGWDTEWSMSFEAHDEAVKQVKEKAANGTLDWNNESEMHPFIDFYADKYKNFDKLKDSVNDVFNKIEDVSSHWWFETDNSQKEDKVILLMHDRAFKNEAASKLKLLIEKLKKNNYLFDIISNYEKEI
jgi:peptidoglycan/xylan/chitin deacetylase (PgdA/CDA1 family)